MKMSSDTPVKHTDIQTDAVKVSEADGAEEKKMLKLFIWEFAGYIQPYKILWETGWCPSRLKLALKNHHHCAFIISHVVTTYCGVDNCSLLLLLLFFFNHGAFTLKLLFPTVRSTNKNLSLCYFFKHRHIWSHISIWISQLGLNTPFPPP